MHSRSIFLMLFSVLVAPHVQCARELEKYFEAKYKECYLLNENHSTLKVTPDEVLQLDRICIAKDNVYKFVSCPRRLPIETPFDNVKIYKMDNEMMSIYARSIESDMYMAAELQFEQFADAKKIFNKYLGPNVIKREKIIHVPLMKKVGKLEEPDTKFYRELEFEYEVELNFIKYGAEKVFIVEKSDVYFVFPERRFQVSRVINGHYVVVHMEGYPTYLMLGFSELDTTDELREKLAKDARTRLQLRFSFELYSFLQWKK